MRKFSTLIFILKPTNRQLSDVAFAWEIRKISVLIDETTANENLS